ncbi:MAG TPA: glutamate-5-semialdehyde dehydrogenase [Bauldia sp.]|nr:glutamate-5-semialdehyde dehydrogenase [Bauldia sp.]
MSVAEVERIATTDVATEMAAIGRAARAAARVLALATTAAKDAALNAAAASIRRNAAMILAENAKDVADMAKQDVASSFTERLTLDAKRVEAIARAVEEVAGLPDPVGSVIAEWDRPNGLHIERVRTPLGVIGIIYESRPNVTADASALCLKAGNAAILRGGSDSFRSSASIHRCFVEGLRAAGLPAEAVQLVPTRDRAAVGAMLTGLDGAIDVIVPRGGKGLVARVQQEARVPVFAHLEGVCTVYIHKSADLEMAKKIVVNAKMRRVSVCGAAETMLVDRAVVATHLKPLCEALQNAGCAIRGDETVRSMVANVVPATEADWSCEYLDAIIAVKVIDGLDAAIAHIGRYGSHHTDSIITNDDAAAAKFLAEVDSAIVLHNASTQFADGGEFGMGAEIGIATGRMHARGPVGVEQLTSFKYRIHGAGQVRP